MKNPVYKDVSSDVLENAIEGVEKLMTTKIYDKYVLSIIDEIVEFNSKFNFDF